MIRALFKKQLLELGAAFVRSSKTGKRRSRAGTLGYALLFAVLMLLVMLSFGSMALPLAVMLVPQGLAWLYFVLMELSALTVSVLASAFTSYGHLFRCRDNQQLLALPIPPGAIFAVRCGGVYLTGLIYLLLAWVVALYVTRQEKLLTGASPWEVFSRLTALHLPPEGFGVGIGLLVLILLGMAVQPRFFCQFLCPMGTVFALLPVLPFARLHRQSDGCIPGCNACRQQCPVCLKLEETSLRSGECIACEACVGTCPKQNIHRWDTALCKHLWLPVLGKALLFFLLGCWLGFCRFI